MLKYRGFPEMVNPVLLYRIIRTSNNFLSYPQLMRTLSNKGPSENTTGGGEAFRASRFIKY